jgi:predicted Zn finger-like uncharacterized protein
MPIVCPSCAGSYNVETASLLPQGSRVRCLRCSTVWYAQLSQADKLLAAAMAIAPEPRLAADAADAPAEPLTVGAPPCAAPASDNTLADGSVVIASDIGDVEHAFDPCAEPAIPSEPSAELRPDDPDSAPPLSLAPALGDVEHVVDASAEPAVSAQLSAETTRACEASDQLAVIAPAVGDAEHAADISADPAEGAADGLAAASLPAVELVEGSQTDEPADMLLPAAVEDHDDPALGEAAEEDTFGDADHSAEADASIISSCDLGEEEPATSIDNNRSSRELRSERTSPGAAWRPRRSAPRRRHPSVNRRFVSRWPISRLQAGIVALFIADALLVGWRSDIVRALPQTASFYALTGLPVNLRGLTFDGVVSTTERQEGEPILVVEGNIVNNTHKVIRVPRLKFAMRNAVAQEIYSWTADPARRSLPPGETVAFRTRLASPPVEARDLVLRFATRRDVVAALR